MTDGLRANRTRALARCSRLALVMGGMAMALPATAQAPRTAPPASVTPHWPAPVKAPNGAPNVLVILLDDVGFAGSSAFGGIAPTPNFDALAAQGLRYNRFHTTAICSPTRTSLLTGRTPHNAEMGALPDFASGIDGYTSVIPQSTATIARILKDGGYNTAMFGKGHLTPLWEQGPAGPFDRWPNGLGFEYFYGFLNGDADQWSPPLVENLNRIEPPARDPSYVLDKDLADHAIDWLHRHEAAAPDKPFFIYYATGTAHAPQSAFPEWIAKFRGKFDRGWDAAREEIFARQKRLGIIPPNTQLTPRPESLPAWDSLSPDRKRLAARFMEAYAAQLAYADAQIGRVIQELKDSGQFDNTLIFCIIGDNGASGEGGVEGRLMEQSWINGYAPDDLHYALGRLDEIGGPKTYNIYPAGWAWAMNTPFRWFKQAASDFGGTRNGMIVSWPKGIKARGELRDQFAHVSDVTPTILESTGVATPATVAGVIQKPMDGISLKYSFNAKAAPSQRHTQYFEMIQNIAMYHDGWVARTVPLYLPWQLSDPQKTSPLEARRWELFDITKDFSEAADLSAKYPAKLAELQRMFDTAAEQNHIFPIHAPGVASAGRPSAAAGRTEFSYAEGVRHIDRDSAPHILNRSFTITADVQLGQPGEGVIIAQGDRFGGYSLYFKDGKPAFEYNAVAPFTFITATDRPLDPGHHVVEINFAKSGTQPGAGGTVTMKIDGTVAGQGQVDRTLPRALPFGDGLDIGADTGSPVSAAYEAPARFNGKIGHVRVKLGLLD